MVLLRAANRPGAARIIVAERDDKTATAVRVMPADAFDPTGARARPARDPRPPETGETPRPAPLSLPARASLGGLRDDPTARRSAKTAGVELREIAPHALLRLVAWPQNFADAEAWLVKELGVEQAPEPGRSALALGLKGRIDARVFRVGPMEWRIDAADRELFERLEPSAKAVGDLSDLTDGLARFEISGPRVKDLLARRLRMDLRDTAFAPDAVATAPFGGFPTLLARLTPSSYAIWPSRSASEWAWSRLSSALERV